jgi:hypothetical protein
VANSAVRPPLVASRVAMRRPVRAAAHRNVRPPRAVAVRKRLAAALARAQAPSALP